MKAHVKILLSVVSLFMLSSPLLALNKSFKWKYKHEDYSVNIDLDLNNYNYYKGLPRGYGYAHYTRELPGHSVVDQVAKAVWTVAQQKGLNEWDALNLSIAFVQQLGYQNEASCKVEHAKYPIETLVDGGGDCEDTAILLAAMLKKLGFASMLISPPGHLAVGVACTNCSGTYIKSNNLKYYYVETTYAGWEIGEKPDQFSTTTCAVYEVYTQANYSIRRLSGGPSTGLAINYTSPTLELVEAKPQVPAVKQPPAPQTIENFDGLNGENLYFPSKMQIEVNGQLITAYTSEDGEVRIQQGPNGEIKIYSTGVSLVVIE